MLIKLNASMEELGEPYDSQGYTKQGLQCVDFIFEEMHRMSIQSDTIELNRFPNLKEKVFEIVHKNLRACVIPTQKMISNLIQIELAYINTSHPDFIGGKMAANLAQSRIKQNQQAAAQPEGTATTIYPNIGTNNPSGNTNNGVTNGSTSNANSSESVDVNSSKKYAVMSNGVNNTPTINQPPNSTTNNSPSTNPQPTQAGGGFLGLFRPSIDKTNDIKADSKLDNKYDNKLDKQSDKQVFKSNENSYKNNNVNNFNVWEDKSVKLPMVPDKMKHSPVLTDREVFDMEVIKCLIASYFDLVKKNFTDMVPKTIMHFLVNAFKESLPHELVAELYKDNLISELMKETDDVANKRKACREMKDLLQKALEIVNEVRDFNSIK
eukprot:gene18712-24471_t